MATQIEILRREATALEKTCETQIDNVHPVLIESTKNLLQYLAFRKKENHNL